MTQLLSPATGWSTSSRAAAITVVVLGHWTIVAVDAGGGISPHGVLDTRRWTHPLTWVFQVMPIFFLVGGYSNALSWRSARRKQIGYAQSLRRRARLRRLQASRCCRCW